MDPLRPDPRPRVVRKPPTFWEFLRDFLCEQSGASSACRLCAVLCTLAACVIAVVHPEAWQAITALIGGGTVALLTRSKAVPGPERP
jgi:hypothetical protein